MIISNQNQFDLFILVNIFSNYYYYVNIIHGAKQKLKLGLIVQSQNQFCDSRTIYEIYYQYASIPLYLVRN